MKTSEKKEARAWNSGQLKCGSKASVLPKKGRIHQRKSNTQRRKIGSEG